MIWPIHANDQWVHILTVAGRMADCSITLVFALQLSGAGGYEHATVVEETPDSIGP